MKLLKDKVIAFLVHLMLSVALISSLYWYIKQYWFPGTLFELEQVWQGLKILMPVDAILGPILTLLFYAKNKKSARIDLTIIATLQIAALVYGTSIIYSQRPVVLSFDIKEFQVITASELDREKVSTEFSRNAKSSELQIVYALPPQNKEEIAHFLVENIAYQKDPTRFKPISEYIDTIAKSSISLEKIEYSQVKNKMALDSIRAYVKKHENSHLLPLRGSLGDSTYILLDFSKNKVITYIDIKPAK